MCLHTANGKWNQTAISLFGRSAAFKASQTNKQKKSSGSAYIVKDAKPKTFLVLPNKVEKYFIIMFILETPVSAL